MLNISLGLEQRNVEKSLRLILSTFKNLKRHVVRPAELKRAKEYAVGTSRMSLERTSSQNMRVGGSVLVYGKIIDPEEVHSRLARCDWRGGAGGSERVFGSASRHRGNRRTGAR